MKPGERWALRGYQIRSDNGRGQHVATYMTDEVDGRVLAAAPTLLEACEAALFMLKDLKDVASISARVRLRAAVDEARARTPLEKPRPA